MKGPYERLKYDMARVWECPACHHHERSDGLVTFRFCKCQNNSSQSARQPMKLIQDAPRRIDLQLPAPLEASVPNEPAPEKQSPPPAESSVPPSARPESHQSDTPAAAKPQKKSAKRRRRGEKRGAASQHDRVAPTGESTAKSTEPDLNQQGSNPVETGASPADAPVGELKSSGGKLVDQQTGDQPAAQEPVVQEPAAQEPAAQEPAAGGHESVEAKPID